MHALNFYPRFDKIWTLVSLKALPLYGEVYVCSGNLEELPLQLRLKDFFHIRYSNCDETL